ncbi:MAG: hypothetical protein ACYTG5_22475 [Planctomycetota bacterium]|jgi:hypothetical protein
MRLYAVCACLALLVVGCQTTQERLLDSGTSQVKLRSIQTRSFTDADKQQCLRTIIATLQDLDFVIDRADHVLGSVSATKLNKYALRMTVTVRPRGEDQLLVRANIQYENKAVHDPGPYQSFFAALEKAMFLTAHQVD